MIATEMPGDEALLDGGRARLVFANLTSFTTKLLVHAWLSERDPNVVAQPIRTTGPYPLAALKRG
jgi:hypothetical protein